MSHSCFEVELEENVAHLRMCRPDALNTFSREFWRELPEIVRELDDAGAARVLVLSSTGRHFTAGLDFELLSSELATDDGMAGRSRVGLREMILQLQESLSCLERARMPVIAAVQGGCVGGGVDMITACDMRYCTEDAFFCIQEINIGITADVGTLQRLPKIIPAGMVRELAYTGRRLPARRAREIGLVNEVYPTQEAMLAERDGDRPRDRRALAPRGLGIQGDAQLRPRPQRRGGSQLHRDLAGGDVPAPGRQRGLRSQAGEAQAGLPGPVAGAQGCSDRGRSLRSTAGLAGSGA